MSLVGFRERDEKNWNDRQVVRATCEPQPVIDVETARARVIAEQLHFQLYVCRTESAETSGREHKNVKRRSRKKYIICEDCGIEFSFRLHKQKKYAERGWSDPKHCPCCLRKRYNLRQKNLQKTA